MKKASAVKTHILKTAFISLIFVFGMSFFSPVFANASAIQSQATKYGEVKKQNSLQTANPPENVTVSSSGKSITVSWSAPSTPPSGNFSYSIDLINEMGTVQSSVVNISSTTSSFTFSNEFSYEYYANVYTVDSSGKSAPAKSSNHAQIVLSAVNNKSSFIDISGETSEVKRAINWLYVYNITAGYEDNTFRPKNTVSRAQTALFMYREAGEPNFSVPKNPFVDIGSQTQETQRAILWLVQNGITTGTDSTHFSPSNILTRVQMATFLYRYCKTPTVDMSQNSFYDITNLDMQFQKAIVWLTSHKITTGYDKNHFKPKNNITRNQMALFLKRLGDKAHINPYTKEATKSSQFFSVISRSQISKFTFQDTLPNCSNSVDLSAEGNGAIQGCVVNNTEVIVGQKGGVIANPDTIAYWLYDVGSSTAGGAQIDLSGLDAGIVDNMEGFLQSAKIKSITFSDCFSQIATNMSSFFEGATFFSAPQYNVDFAEDAQNLHNMYKNVIYPTGSAKAQTLSFPDDFGLDAEDISGMFANDSAGQTELPAIAFPAGFATYMTDFSNMFLNATFTGAIDLHKTAFLKLKYCAGSNAFDNVQWNDNKLILKNTDAVYWFKQLAHISDEHIVQQYN
ncbi:MAG: S-layer homology domain-containing protein [Bifidobacteriaceae bacterium]|jgi:hypothetical protein|nr:S-layer homology domain-containing protein [Bifidobacteriaceae bacterium]